MLVLFDHGTPRGIARALQGHSVKRGKSAGLGDKLSNGELLKAAEDAGFDVLLTTDTNLPHQQNLEGRKLAIVILSKNRWSLVRPVMQQIANAVNAARPGTCTLVDIPQADRISQRASGFERSLRGASRSRSRLGRGDWAPITGHSFFSRRRRIPLERAAGCAPRAYAPLGE
jgi:hypothetical protein